ncbi:MAG: HMA2 domain-containing protein [Dissulfurispiraceae bacterium]
MEYYIHQVPGRLRIRTPILHNNPKKNDEFIKNIKNLNGILSLKVNPLTGSALLLYDEKKINCEQLIGILEKYGYFNLATSTTSDELVEHISEKALGIAEVIVETIGGVPEA